MDDFLTRLAAKLEVDNVRREDVLQDFSEWDSLTILSVLAMIDADCGVQIGADELARIETVGDLDDLVKAKQHGNG